MNKKQTLPLICILGMPIILIITSFMTRANINFFGEPLFLSVFLYPLTNLISGLIVKKAGYKKGLLMMSLSLVSSALAFIVQWALLNTMDYFAMIYIFMSVLINQLIFIYTYDFLLKINKNTYLWVFLLVVVVSAIDNAFFGAIIEGKYVSLSILVRIIYAVVIPVFLAKKSK